MPKCRAAEKHLLEVFLDPGLVNRIDTEISLPTGGKSWIHSVEVPGDAALPPLVCLPGYGTGAAIFAPAWKQLLATNPWAAEGSKRPTLIAVDPLGWYLSGHPKWTCGVDAEKAEKWFADSLEAWRIARVIILMDLLGHSIGGNIAASYAERHPDHVRMLVLLSPAGVPGEPQDYRTKLRAAPWQLRLLMGMWGRGYSPFDALRLFPRPAKGYGMQCGAASRPALETRSIASASASALPRGGRRAARTVANCSVHSPTTSTTGGSRVRGVETWPWARCCIPELGESGPCPSGCPSCAWRASR